MDNTVSRARRYARRAAIAAVHRVNPNSRLGLAWRQDGPYITFEWDGFVQAPTIPTLFARHNYETEVIRQALSGGTPGRLLEVGCGFGRLSPTFARLASQHVGIDINASALASATACYQELTFQRASVTELPFP